MGLGTRLLTEVTSFLDWGRCGSRTDMTIARETLLGAGGEIWTLPNVCAGLVGGALIINERLSDFRVSWG